LAKILRYPISQLPLSLVFRFARAFPLSILFHSFRFGGDKFTQEAQVEIFTLANQRLIWAKLHFHFLVMVEAPMPPKIMHPLRPIFHWILLIHTLGQIRKLCHRHIRLILKPTMLNCSLPPM